MLLIISILIILMGFVLQSNKKVTYVMLLWMWVLFAFNTMNGDYVAYENIYNAILVNRQSVIETYEDGFVFLCKFFGTNFQLNYAQFVILLAAFATILFGVLLHLFCQGRKQNVVISLFMIFLYWMMICQHRTYIASLFILLGCYFLYKKQDHWGSILFFVCLMLGMMFHQSVAFFSVIYLVKRCKRKTLFWLVPVLMASIFLVRSPVFMSFLSQYAPIHKLQRWLYDDGDRTALGLLAVIVSRFSLPAIQYYCYASDIKRNLNSAYMEMQNYIIKITYVCLTFVPLEIFARDYERLARIPLFLAFVYFANYLSQVRLNTRKIPIGVILFICYFVLYMGIFYISFSGWFTNNLVPIVTQNSLFAFG